MRKDNKGSREIKNSGIVAIVTTDTWRGGPGGGAADGRKILVEINGL